MRWPAIALSVGLAIMTSAVSAVSAAGEIHSAFGTTAVPAMPQRVITLFQGATDTAVALGIEPVGVVDSWVEQPMYRYLRNELSGVAHVGTEIQPNLEEIAWLQPDLIVATRYRNQQIRGLLEDMAATVATTSVFDFKATLRLMGEATGHQARAAELLDEWNRRVDEFRQRIGVLLGDGWPHKVAVVRFKSNEARIYYSGFAGSILDELGFERPANQQGDGWGVKLSSRESIPAMNADVMFVFMNDDDPAVLANYRRWTRSPLWQTLDAVEHGRVYRVDPVIWSMGGGIIAANRLLDDVYAHYGLASKQAAPPSTGAASSRAPRQRSELSSASRR